MNEHYPIKGTSLHIELRKSENQNGRGYIKNQALNFCKL